MRIRCLIVKVQLKVSSKAVRTLPFLTLSLLKVKKWVVAEKFFEKILSFYIFRNH